MAKRRRRSSGEPEVEAVEPHEVQPLDVDGVRTVAVVTVLWAVAFVLLALRMDSLQAEGRGWWVWTCLAGVGLGLLGLEYTRKRRDAIEFEREEARRAAAEARGAVDDPHSDVLTRGEVIARDTDVAVHPQTTPDSVTRSIDPGADLPPVRPETTRTDATRADLPPTRPAPDPRGARPDTTAHGRPSWSGEPGALPGGPAPVPGTAERPAAPSRPAAGERPVARSQRPGDAPQRPPAAAPRRPAAEVPPRSGLGDRPSAVQRPGIASPRAGAASRPDPGDAPAGVQRPGDGSPGPGAAPQVPAAAPPPRAGETPQQRPAAPQRPAAHRTPPPSELFGEPLGRPAAPADDDEPLLDTLLGGGRPAPADDAPAGADADDTTEGGSRYRGRRARRSDTA